MGAGDRGGVDEGAVGVLLGDAVRAGVLAPEDLPADEIAVLGERGSRRIDRLVHDLVEHSEAAGDIVQSEDVGGAMDRLRTFMFEHVYLAPAAQSEHPRIERMLRALFEHFAGDDPDWVADYISGMTDRYAIRTFSDLFLPRGF